MPGGYDSDNEEDSDNSDDESDDSEGESKLLSKQKKKKKIPVTFRSSSHLLGKIIARRVKVHQKLAQEKAGDYDYDEVSQIINTTIHYDKDDWDKQAESDLKIASEAFRTGDVETILKLKTKFCIAHYRGVTYGRNNFSTIARREHREQYEVREDEGVRPLFSVSVLEACGVGVADYNSGVWDEQKEIMDELDTCAKLLKQILLKKRDKIEGGLKYGSIAFDSHADLLQHIYTNNYKHTFSSIKVALASKQGLLKSELTTDISKIKPKYKEDDDELLKLEKYNDTRNLKMSFSIQSKLGLKLIPSDWEAYEGLFNASNPFVSTGDTPRHALKYAYGMKFYGEQKKHRLFPSWDKDTLRIKKPYSGKAYILLHSLVDYLADAPLHVPTLNSGGRIRVGDEIVEERETTFPSYVPRERVVYEHIAKLPSFDEYTGHHLEKYGLDEKDFKLYAKALVESDSSVLSKHGNQIQESRPIEAWLVNFHEARMIELARRMAKSRGMLLVYKAPDGGLCKQLTSVRRNKEVDLLLHKREEGPSFKDHDYSFEYSKEVQALAERFSKSKKELLGEYERMQTLKKNYHFHHVKGDGNCLFRALSLVLEKANVAQLDHIALRIEICRAFDTLANLKKDYKLSELYLNNMRKPALSARDLSRWGSDAELAGCAARFGVKIIVILHRAVKANVSYVMGNAVRITISTDGYMKFERSFSDKGPTVVLLHENGNHFTPLVLKGG